MFVVKSYSTLPLLDGFPADENIPKFVIIYPVVSQMAEMYGEVMELNERLHKEIATKDKSIESMTARLRKAGLEVRVHITNN